MKPYLKYNFNLDIRNRNISFSFTTNLPNSNNQFFALDQPAKMTQAHPIFNDKYEILKSCGEGNTSKVYVARLKGDPYSQPVAIKILKEEFLRRDQESIISVNNEIKILKNVKHPGIIDMKEFGDTGTVVKPSTRVI